MNPDNDGALAFMKKFVYGHRIVPTGNLTELQISEARVQDRLYVEPGDGLCFGWVALPWDLSTSKDCEREKQLLVND
ncbi:hypothetical protein PY247_10535 [Acinetobacter proteolyticus]|nr:hypothetical protein [Acinetobacter proteolyticus]WEI20110.1 hypothetical protein PY247_10535 [Acinetobacter proteolyticus]